MSYSKRSKTSTVECLGEGKVDKVIHPNKSWRVKFQGSYWSAESENDIALDPGDFVRIIGIRSTRLIIEPS